MVKRGEGEGRSHQNPKKPQACVGETRGGQEGCWEKGEVAGGVSHI